MKGIPESNVRIVDSNANLLSDGLKNEVIKNIEFLFDSDMFEKEIAKSEIEAIVYKTKNGAEEVKSFVLISGWQEAQENVFYRLDNVVFQ